MFTLIRSTSITIYTNNIINEVMKGLFRFLAIMMCIVFCHWLIVTVYRYFCVPTSVYNVLTSMFMMASPICITLNKVQLSLAEHYITFITAAASSIMAWLVHRITN